MRQNRIQTREVFDQVGIVLNHTPHQVPDAALRIGQGVGQHAEEVGSAHGPPLQPPALEQGLQVPTDRGLGKSHHLNQLPHPQLRPLQKEQEPHPDGI